MPAAPVTRSLFAAAAALALLFAATSAGAQSVAKCRQPDGRVIYTDGFCPSNSAAGAVNVAPNSIDRSAERDTVARIYAEHGATPPGAPAWGGGAAPPGLGQIPQRPVPGYDGFDPNPPSTSVDCDRATRALDQASFRLAHTNERTYARQKSAVAQRRAEVQQEMATSEVACGRERAAERSRLAAQQPLRQQPYQVHVKRPPSTIISCNSGGFCYDDKGGVYSAIGTMSLQRLSDGKTCSRLGGVVKC